MNYRNNIGPKLKWLYVILHIAMMVVIVDGQNLKQCNCLTCTDTIKDNSRLVIDFDITGAINNDLSSPTQGLCKIFLKFTHEFISDVTMKLVSPSGQEVDLIGPYFNNNSALLTKGTRWDISFVDTFSMPKPDSTYTIKWNNAQQWSIFSQYYGNYFPFKGNLNDFNQGTVNGKWQLIIDDFGPDLIPKIGFLEYVQLQFCDEAGLNCRVCRADPGSMSGIPPLNYCENDSISIIIAPKFEKGIPNPENYNLKFILSKDSTILNIYDNKTINLTGYASGKYLINTISYSKSDSTKAQIITPNIKLKTLLDSINSTYFNYCAKVSDSSIIINILPVQNTKTDVNRCDGSTYSVGNKVYSKSGNYIDTLTNNLGCDSIITTNLKFHAKFDTLLRINICKNDTLKFGGQSFNKNGLYNINFKNQYGCDSSYNILLTLKDTLITNIKEIRCFGDSFSLNNKTYFNSGKYQIATKSKGGCDSIINLDLLIKPKLTSAISKYICNGDSITIGKSVYYTSGPKLDTLKTSNGCDSIIFLNLFVGTEKIREIDTTICQGNFVMFKNEKLFSSGIFRDTSKVSNSCDSITILNLIVKQKPVSNLVKIICKGQFYQLGNKIYTQSGTYSDTTFSSQSNICDSITNLYLYVKDYQTYNYNIELCEGATYQIGDSLYNSTGHVSDTLVTKDGCDSLINVNLNFLPKKYFSQNITICKNQNYIIGNSVYSISGTYIDTLQSPKTGCDSIVTTNLSIVNKYNFSETFKKCDGDSIIIRNRVFKTSQTYIDSLKSVGGCDSIINYNLVFNPRFNDTLYRQICSNQTYTFNGVKIDKPGTYTNRFISNKYLCDSIVTLVLVVNDTFARQLDTTICEGHSVSIGVSKFDKTGFYPIVFSNNIGCDSTIYLNLTVMENTIDTVEKTICRGQTVKIGNSTYSSSGIYKDIFTNTKTCDSIVVLKLTVIDSVVTSSIQNLCLGDSIVFGNQTIKSGGDYKAYFKNINGCDSISHLKIIEHSKPNPIKIQTTICALDSIELYGKKYKGLGIITDTLHLAAPNTCDTAVYIQINFTTKFSTNIDSSICEGSFVEYNNQKYSQSGFYKINLKSKAGCDSLINLNLNVNTKSTTFIDTSICIKDSFSIGNKVFFDEGNYTIILKNQSNCDSTIYLNLKKNQFYIHEEYKEICEGDSVHFGKLICKTSGTYTDTIRSNTTCDSLNILKLLVNFSQTVRIEKNICDGDSILIFGKYYKDNINTSFYINNPNGCDTTFYIKVNKHSKYFAKKEAFYCKGDSVFVLGKFYSTEGDYFIRYNTVNGCDSIILLTIKMNPTYLSTRNETICSHDSIVINGKTFNKTGIYNILGKTINGCDSTITLNLNVIDYIKTNDNVQKCMGDSYPFGNQIITKSGIYIDTINNSSSCDTIKTLNINFVDTIFQNLDTSICAGSWLIYNNQKIDKPGKYRFPYKSQFNCDSIIQINLISKPTFADTIHVSQCENKSYDFYGSIIKKTGYYQKIFTATNYCDSIITLDYQSIPIFTKNIDATICENKSIIINQKKYQNSGIYSDTIKNNNACDTILKININVLSKIEQSITLYYCEGDTISLNNKKIYYSSIFSDTLQSINNCDSIVNYNLVFRQKSYTDLQKTICETDTMKPGIYQYKFLNQFGCDSIVTLFVTKIICSFESILTPVDAKCANSDDGKVIIQIIGGVAPYKYSWKDLQDKLYEKIMLGTFDSITGLLPGNYTISITDNNNNSQIKNAKINSPPPLIVKVASIPSYGNYQLKCSNSLDGYATISVQGGASNYQYLWSNGAITQDLDKLVAGNYQLTVTDKNGCVDTSIHIHLNAPPLPKIDITTTDPKCYDEKSGTVSIQIDNSKAPYTFSFDNQKYDTSRFYRNLNSGIYFVRILDKYGCLYEQQVKLEQPNKLEVDLGADQEIIIGSNAIIKASISFPKNEIDSIIWSNGNNCSDCDSIKVNPLVNTTYSVRVVSKNGCVATDELTILVNIKPYIEMPNAITPNDDGMNDAFFLDFLANGNNPFPDNELAIYNRWGDMVFRAKPYLNNWKGTNQSGNPLPAGTYYYILRLSLNEGSVYQGDITIIK